VKDEPCGWTKKGEVLKALQSVLHDAKRPKIVHDPKLFQLLAGKSESIEHATQIYSYLLRPTTAKHDFAEVVFRQFNVPLGGGVGERADYLQRIAPILREQIAAQQLTDVYEKIDLPLAPVLAEMERAGVRVDPQSAGNDVEGDGKKKFGGWRRRSGNWRD